MLRRRIRKDTIRLKELSGILFRSMLPAIAAVEERAKKKKLANLSKTIKMLAIYS